MSKGTVKPKLGYVVAFCDGGQIIHSLPVSRQKAITYLKKYKGMVAYKLQPIGEPYANNKLGTRKRR